MEYLGDEFIDCDMDIVKRADVLDGYKLVMIFYNASWCGTGCGDFRAQLKAWYPEWNKDGEKNIQIISVTMDRNEGEYETTMEEVPWIGMPWGFDKMKIKANVPNPSGGHPSPSILNGATGEVMKFGAQNGNDVFSVIKFESVAEWISKIGA